MSRPLKANTSTNSNNKDHSTTNSSETQTNDECLSGDITKCTKLNEHANKINGNGLSYDKNKHPYFVPLNKIIPDTTEIDPLLLSSMGNNITYNDLQNRYNIKLMSKINKYLDLDLSKVYPNKDSDLNDLMTYSNAKVAYCMKRKQKNGEFYIPSIYGKTDDNPAYTPNKKIGSDIMLTALESSRHKIELNNIKFGNNPFDLGKGEENDEYYCNRFMPIYCQNVIEFLKNKFPDETYTQKDLIRFAPQCACYGHTVSELLLSDDKIKLDSNSISTLKSIPRVCSLEGCGQFSYHPDEADECKNSYNIQVCNNNMSFDKNDLQAGKDILIDSYNNCTQNTGTSSIGDLKKDDDNQKSDGSSDNNGSDNGSEPSGSEGSDTKGSEPEPSEPEPSDTDGSDTKDDTNKDKTAEDSGNITETDQQETPVEEQVPVEETPNTLTEKEEKKEEKSNTTLYIILAIVAVVVVIIIIVIIVVVSKRKSMSGGAPHIADFGHLIRSSKK